MTSKRLISAAVLSAGVMVSSGAQAANFCDTGTPGGNAATGTLVGNICTLAGPNITWIYDKGTMTTSGALGKYDFPTLVGDAIRFLPPSFRAESINAVGIHSGGQADSITANFIFTSVKSNAGVGIAAVTSVDFGDYSITSNPLSLDDTVTAALRLQATPGPSATDTGDLFFPQINLQNFPPPPAIADGSAHNWSLTAVVTPAAAWAVTGTSHSTDDAKDLALSVQNTLTAKTNQNGEDAWIQKKINLDVTLVPVPAAVWLFGSGLGLLGLARRKAS